MGMGSKTCARCGGRMEEGRIVARDSNGGRGVPGWVPGVPRRSFWTGLKVAKDKIREVATYRCGKCGLLEDYAE